MLIHHLTSKPTATTRALILPIVKETWQAHYLLATVALYIKQIPFEPPNMLLRFSCVGCQYGLAWSFASPFFFWFIVVPSFPLFF